MTITAIIIDNGAQEELEKTRASLCGFENKAFELQIITVQNEAEALQRAALLPDGECAAILQSGEFYEGDAFRVCAGYLAEHPEMADVVCPEHPNKKSGKGAAGVVIHSMSTIEEIRKAPACFGGMVFRTEAGKRSAEQVQGEQGTLLLELFFLQLLIQKRKLAYAKGAMFHGKSPLNENCGFCREWTEVSWYQKTVEAYRNLLSESDDLLAQSQVLYGLRTMFQMNMGKLDKGAFDRESFEPFYEVCSELLKKIDSKWVGSYSDSHPQRYLNPALVGKFEEMRCDFSIPVKLLLLEAENGVLRMDFEAEEFQTGKNGEKLLVSWNGKKCPFQKSERISTEKYFGVTFEKYLFYLELPIEKLKNKNKLTMAACQNGTKIPLKMVSSGYQSRISSAVSDSYWCFGPYMVCFQGKAAKKTALQICRAGRISRIAKELRVLAQMPFGPNRSRNMLAWRVRYWLAYPRYSGKNIWLTFDKLYKGGDCGEYFFKYLSDHAGNEVTPAYVIRGDAPDRKRLEKEGYKPLVFGSKEQKLSYLYSKMVFATHSSIHALNGFNAWEVQYIQDRLQAVNVCIQHGLSVQDLTEDSNRIVNNNKRYYCASKYEIENLRAPGYDYGDDVLRLTGIPRFDGLKNAATKQILLTPTWRSYLAMPAVVGSARPYNPQFKNSEYYRLYQELLTDSRLLESAKQNGYQLLYVLHPVISAQKQDFEESELVQIRSALEIDYETVLRESALMVTDYSGVQFDFAYMRKPVVYYQPATLPAHYAEGGFHYESQSFGEICEEKEALVSLLCEYMEQGCALKPFYRERQEDFFAFSDDKSCERIYQDAMQYYKNRH